MSNNITCPNCGHQFSLSDVQKHELEHMRGEMQETIQAEMQKEYDQKKREYATKVNSEAEEKIQKAKFDAEEVSKKMAIENESLKKFETEARAKEMEFFKKTQEFEQIQKNQLFEIEKAKSEERKKVEEESKKSAEERAKFDMEKILLERDKRESELRKQLEMTQKAVEDANRKANQGSMQIQGEIQEDALKSILERMFVFDNLYDIEKGRKGADVIQEVRNEFGQNVGVIAWESKNAKGWKEEWVDKLKEDRIRVNANLSILVSVVMPKGVEKFGIYNGVFVIEWGYVEILAPILRNQVIELANKENSLTGKDEKMEALYNYFTSPKFKDKIENIIDAFKQMKEQVDEERRAFEKRWKTREQLLETVIKNTSGMYGDLGGMLGGKLEKVDYLELGGGL